VPVTFYKDVAQLPVFENYAMKGRAYRYFEGTPVYPFGYGLSYTRFSYGSVSIKPRGNNTSDGIVETQMTNTGGRPHPDLIHYDGEFNRS
jgi:beta-glucosidase